MAEEHQSPESRIVVGVDLSEAGDLALRHAMALAQKVFGSELHVAYVIRAKPSLHDAKQLDMIADELRGKVEDLREHVAEVCASMVEEGAFPQETVCHVRVGEPADAIHQLAVDVDADLIVVGTHGRSGVQKLLLGSVAEALVRSAHVPVLVARAKDYADLEKTARIDQARPGEDMSPQGLSRRVHWEIVPRNTHISGLI